jgi:hypothetical protein
VKLEIRSEGGHVCHQCGATDLIRTADTYEELAEDLSGFVAAEVTLAEFGLVQRWLKEKNRMLEVVAQEKAELRERMLQNRVDLERHLVALFERPLPWYRPLARRRQERWRAFMERLVGDYRNMTYRV